MENDFLTAGDLALMENYRGGHKDYGCGCGCGRSHNTATTGIGLAAGLGGGALLLAIAGIWGVNQASKARQRGNESQINALTNFAFLSHNNTAAWQLQHTPTVSQMVDVRTGAQASAQSTALANAESALLTNALLGKTQCCPDEVTLVSKQYCPCPAPQCGCGCGCN